MNNDVRATYMYKLSSNIYSLNLMSIARSDKVYTNNYISWIEFYNKLEPQ